MCFPRLNLRTYTNIEEQHQSQRAGTHCAHKERDPVPCDATCQLLNTGPGIYCVTAIGNKLRWNWVTKLVICSCGTRLLHRGQLRCLALGALSPLPSPVLFEDDGVLSLPNSLRNIASYVHRRVEKVARSSSRQLFKDSKRCVAEEGKVRRGASIILGRSNVARFCRGGGRLEAWYMEWVQISLPRANAVAAAPHLVCASCSGERRSVLCSQSCSVHLRSSLACGSRTAVARETDRIR